MTDNRIVQAIRDQIKVAGSVNIYNIIKNSFTRPPHIYFMKEQFALYKWRKEFFLTHFPQGTWNTDCNFGCGKLGIPPEGHSMAAIHYNITENFDQVLKLAFDDSRPDTLYFHTDYFSPWFQNKFEWDTVEEQEVLQKLTTVDFSTAVHILCVLYSCSPPSLLQMAMRRVMELGQSIDSVPKEVQVLAIRGLYYSEGREASDGLEQSERPKCLSREGGRMLGMFFNQ